MRVRATGNWAFVVGAEFDVFDNTESVQAIHGTRVVYVSSLSISTQDGPAPAAEIRARAAAVLDCGETLKHHGQSTQGAAAIHHDIYGWHLKGFTCSDGTMATCVVDFQNPGDRSWAISVWESLTLERVAA